MKKNKVRVGIIGASLDGTWGGLVHIPALLSLPEYEITAVSTTRKESANKTAQHFGIPHAFTDPYELASHPDVDLVTITVKVPEHSKLVQIALDAGKSVYCEFPLGRTLDETVDLIQKAEEKGVRHFVGLQSRANPAIRYLKDLIADQHIGKILAVHCNYALPLFPSRSKQVNQSRTYLLNKLNGANHLTITAGHLLDGLTYLFGSFSEISSILETQSNRIQVVETGEFVHADAPDHVVINGKFENGAIMSTQIRNTHVGNLTIEINGTEGDLVLQSNENFMFQIDSFTVKGTKNNKFEELPVPPSYFVQPTELKSGPAYNVAGLYRMIYHDLQENTHLAPNFHTALSVHKLINVIQKAADTGKSQKVYGG
ncbi:Gfo/Idh/MocA family oxidoreductase [Shimazuella sp. AN120528]|uniref:Gfo/Idh/MocA family protein n=1 Tax=Shimazuella soli TaxID=1892854 RepID=UPI001F0DF957|nr:Gfo/Idh/MocA family oxidoreductase [Shimazuella soli]MCH5583676.1 Gfo/Idh/MocA family oxidoreductase [Shimazuella soli]